ETIIQIQKNVLKKLKKKFNQFKQNIAVEFSNPDGEGLTDKVKGFVEQASEFIKPIIESVQEAFEKVTTAIANNQDSFDSLFEA
ncbi:hypothetical protein NP569_26440, partial [Vibrio parahaemolyticus]|nr:hypothetical protein [Vibrio parahaemolyticus]